MPARFPAGAVAILIATIALSSREASGAPPAGTAAGAPLPAPERPRAEVTLPPETPTGRQVRVPAGGDLQHALDAAAPGDLLLLAPGATYAGRFTLPRKEGAGWIVVRTDPTGADLPARGTRVTPAGASRFARLETSGGAVITAAPGAHHYALVGLEIRPAAGAFLKNVVILGSDEPDAAAAPHDIVLDRVYLHGDPAAGSRRGVALNGASLAVVDSWLSDFKEEGADSQAVAGWNGPGPFLIRNNHLEGAGENLIFGGTTPARQGLVPSDITISGNHLFKPAAWRIGDPAYAGTPWSVKNLLELKNARRVLIEGNLLENNWAHGQNGFAVLFTVRTEDGHAPWAVVEEVTFTGNVVRQAGAGINILGIDDGSPRAGGHTRNLLISQNLFLGIGAAGLGGPGTLFQILNGAERVTIAHNTARHTGSIIAADLAPSPQLVFRDNVVEHNAYGVFGSGLGSGRAAIEHYFPGGVFEGNVLIGTPQPGAYPRGNFHPRALEEVGFRDAVRGDYRLAPTSRYRGAATDGGDVGADVARLAALAAAESGAGGAGR